MAEFTAEVREVATTRVPLKGVVRRYAPDDRDAWLRVLCELVDGEHVLWRKPGEYRIAVWHPRRGWVVHEDPGLT